MNVLLNGKPRTLTTEATVADLLLRMNMAPIRVAVEINEQLVSRKNFSETKIQEGDRIEVVTFVGGG
ncbi:MAG: sulfur carrier protein ThiS [Planctomycetes bacterium]|nr:sulfur carrier protein ThiS [Planctomycetota bacterium]